MLRHHHVFWKWAIEPASPTCTSVGMLSKLAKFKTCQENASVAPNLLELSLNSILMIIRNQMQNCGSQVERELSISLKGYRFLSACLLEIGPTKGHLSSATMPAWLAEGAHGQRALAWNSRSNSSHCRSGLPSCPSCPWSLKTTSLVFPLYVATPDHPQSTHALKAGALSALFILDSPYFNMLTSCRGVVSQGIVYEIVLVHHAPLVGTSSTVTLPSSQLPACQRSNKERQIWDAWNIDLHDMLRPKDVQATCWDIQASSLLLLASSTPHERNTPCWPLNPGYLSRCDLRHRIAIWENMAALWFETETRCDMNHLPGDHDLWKQNQIHQCANKQRKTAVDFRDQAFLFSCTQRLNDGVLAIMDGRNMRRATNPLKGETPHLLLMTEAVVHDICIIWKLIKNHRRDAILSPSSSSTGARVAAGSSMSSMHLHIVFFSGDGSSSLTWKVRVGLTGACEEGPAVARQRSW